jgi:hypothetical protein
MFGTLGCKVFLKIGLRFGQKVRVTATYGILRQSATERGTRDNLRRVATDCGNLRSHDDSDSPAESGSGT